MTDSIIHWLTQAILLRDCPFLKRLSIAEQNELTTCVIKFVEEARIRGGIHADYRFNPSPRKCAGPPLCSNPNCSLPDGHD